MSRIRLIALVCLLAGLAALVAIIRRSPGSAPRGPRHERLAEQGLSIEPRVSGVDESDRLPVTFEVIVTARRPAQTKNDYPLAQFLAPLQPFCETA